MKIKTLVKFSGVPKDTTGTAEHDENLWKITWDLPPKLFGMKRKPLQDWFDQKEFDKYLEVVN